MWPWIELASSGEVVKHLLHVFVVVGGAEIILTARLRSCAHSVTGGIFSGVAVWDFFDGLDV